MNSINRFATGMVLAAMTTFMGFSHAVAGQDASVVAKASTSSVRVAEPFSLELTVTAPAASKVTFPSMGKQIGDFDVVDTQDLFDIPDATSADTRTWTRRMTLESIVTGDLSIAPIEIQVSGHGGPQVIRSKAIKIQVVSVLEDRGDPTKFRDIQSVVDVPVPARPSNAWVWWTLSSVAALALLAAAGMVASRRGKWVTPQEWAIQALEELEKSVDHSSMDSEWLASKLSKIVCDYLQLQFNIPESGNTAHELVRLLESNQQVDSGIADRLNELFTLADKAKFAGLELSPAGLKSAINDSRILIQRIAEELETKSGKTDATENK